MIRRRLKRAGLAGQAALVADGAGIVIGDADPEVVEEIADRSDAGL
jgi:hypothetical protein